MKADVTTLGASKAGTVELPEAIFGLKPRPDLIQRMVRYQLLKRRAGTHHAQDRSEVHVTGKKMYKQKGTGGARHGDKSVPQWQDRGARACRIGQHNLNSGKSDGGAPAPG